MSNKQQRLAHSIIEFLNQAIQEKTVTAAHSRTLEVAIGYIGGAFGINPFDETQSKKLSVEPTSLQSIFDVYLQTRDFEVQSTSAPAPQVVTPPVLSNGPPSLGTERVPSSTGPSASDRAEAERFQQTGNTLLSIKDYDTAVQSYTTAIALDPTNPVYYSDRAAARSYQGHHLSAMNDAEIAIAVDPNFANAYGWLGRALYSYGNSIFKASARAFERGLRADPNDESLRSGLQLVRTKMTDTYIDGIPDLSNIPDFANMDTPQLLSSGQQMAESFLQNLTKTFTNMVNDVRNLGD